jgi:hypothetical protein
MQRISKQVRYTDMKVHVLLYETLMYSSKYYNIKAHFQLQTH